MNVVAFSGGWDSTSLCLRLAELGETFTMLFTPTGNELPDLLRHVDAVRDAVGMPLVTPENRTLFQWIDEFNALPNFRQRWCTRLIKIVPCIAWLKANPGSTLMVGLRADEEHRVGLYGDYAEYRYPLREWEWKREDVENYVRARGVIPPARTDCALCYGQRLGEWYALWRDHPEEWAKGEECEARTGHTFRSAQRDTWPAAMADLRKEFECGRVPRTVKLDQLEEQQPCRVCRF